jgi:hypothetical protein
MLLAATHEGKTAETLLVRLYGKDFNMHYIIYSCILYLRAATTQSISLDGPGIESRWGEIFRILPDLSWGSPSLLNNGYRVLPGGKAARAWR